MVRKNEFGCLGEVSSLILDVFVWMRSLIFLPWNWFVLKLDLKNGEIMQLKDLSLDIVFIFSPSSKAVILQCLIKEGSTIVGPFILGEISRLRFCRIGRWSFNMVGGGTASCTHQRATARVSYIQPQKVSISLVILLAMIYTKQN